MYNNLLAEKKSFSEINGEQVVDFELNAFEAYIEKGLTKEGEVLLNKDGSTKYFPVDDSLLFTNEEEMKAKKISENFYKKVYECNGDYVELVDKEARRMYFQVDSEKVVNLEAGKTFKDCKNGCFKEVFEKGVAVYDVTDKENPKLIRVRLFSSDDHKAEAEMLLQTLKYYHK